MSEKQHITSLDLPPDLRVLIEKASAEAGVSLGTWIRQAAVMRLTMAVSG